MRCPRARCRCRPPWKYADPWPYQASSQHASHYRITEYGHVWLRTIRTQTGAGEHRVFCSFQWDGLASVSDELRSSCLPCCPDGDGVICRRPGLEKLKWPWSLGSSGFKRQHLSGLSASAFFSSLRPLSLRPRNFGLSHPVLPDTSAGLSTGGPGAFLRPATVSPASWYLRWFSLLNSTLIHIQLHGIWW